MRLPHLLRGCFLLTAASLFAQIRIPRTQFGVQHVRVKNPQFSNCRS